MKIRAFLLFKPLGKVITKILMRFALPIYLQLKKIKIKLIHSTEYFYELVLSTHFIWVSMSTYVYNSTLKVLLLAEIGVRV